jgi:hypothetical protein
MKYLFNQLLWQLLSEDGYVLVTEFARVRRELRMRVRDFFSEDSGEWLSTFVESLAESVRDEMSEESEDDEDDEDDEDLPVMADGESPTDYVQRVLRQSVEMLDYAMRWPSRIPPPPPPESTEATRRLFATLKPDDRVMLATGLHTVLEAPTVVDGWEMVKVTPMRTPRPGTADPTFYLVPLCQVRSPVGWVAADQEAVAADKAAATAPTAAASVDFWEAGESQTRLFKEIKAGDRVRLLYTVCVWHDVIEAPHMVNGRAVLTVAPFSEPMPDGRESYTYPLDLVVEHEPAGTPPRDAERPTKLMELYARVRAAGFPTQGRSGGGALGGDRGTTGGSLLDGLGGGGGVGPSTVSGSGGGTAADVPQWIVDGLLGNAGGSENA